MCIYIYTMEYYLTIKNKILPFTTTWMDIEGIMLSEIRQRKTNTIGYHLYVESNEQNKMTYRIETEAWIHMTD